MASSRIVKHGHTRIQCATLVALPLYVLLALVISAGVLALLVYGGIALPAVWSAKPARRKAAADVLRQILTLIASISHKPRNRLPRATQPQSNMPTRPLNLHGDEFSTHEFVYSNRILGNKGEKVDPRHCLPRRAGGQTDSRRSR